MSKIGKGPQNIFQRDAAALRNAADDLKDGARDMVKEAGKDVNAAGAHGNAAAGHLAGAAANAIYATGAVVNGTVDALEAGGHVVAAGGFAAAGAAGWSIEGMAGALRFAAKNVARAFGKLANMLTNGLLKDGKTVTVRELAGDPNAVRFSDKMFGEAAGQLNKSSEHMNASWNSYVQAVGHMGGSAANMVYAAAHTAAVAGHLTKAAGEVGAAGAMKLAEVGTRAAAVAVEFAEKGVGAARDVAILSAQISAATANALAVAGQGEVKVDVAKQIAGFEAELKALQAAA